MSKIKEEKTKMRKHFREMRDKMTAQYKRSLDIEIASRLLCSIEYMKAKTLLIYMAKPSEIETRDIIHAAFALKKQVALPKCFGEGVMKFYIINSMDDLKVGFRGILEPDTDKCKELTDFTDSLCVVPALSFDPKGNRLGFGGGYYDRFLESYKGISAGLCYSSFMKWDLPAESHDIPVDILVTDRFLRHTKDK